MKTILYIIAGIIFLSIGPQLILGAVFTVGIIFSCTCSLRALQAILEALAVVVPTNRIRETDGKVLVTHGSDYPVKFDQNMARAAIYNADLDMVM